MYCHNCGTEILENSKFCGNCGCSLLEAAEHQPAVEEIPAPEPLAEMQVTKQKTKKERRYFRLIHTIPLSILLVAIFVSLFLPMVKFDSNTVNEITDSVVQDVASEMRKTSNANKDECIAALEDEVENWKADGFSEKIENGVQNTLDTSGTTISMWNVFMLPDDVVNRALLYYSQETGSVNSYHMAWESETEDMIFIAKIVIGAIGIVTILLLIAIILVTIRKRTKFICLIFTTIFSLILTVGSAFLLWGLPGVIWQEIPVSDLGIGNGYESLMNKLIGRIVYTAWEHMAMPGLYLLFIAAVLLLLISIVSMITFSKKRSGKKAAISNAPLLVILICGVSILSLSGCGVRDTEIDESERVQLEQAIDTIMEQLEIEKEWKDYKTLESVYTAFDETRRELDLNYVYNKTSEELEGQLKEGIEEKLGKTIEEVEDGFQADICKGQKIYFYLSYISNRISVSIGSPVGISSENVTFKIYSYLS